MNSNTKFMEISNKEKIYAYSFPHYVTHPHIENQDGFSDKRYMLNIGRTTNEASKRVFQQRTAMPEDPVLYYVFNLGESGHTLEETERKIHDHLKTIGHRRATDSGGGKEWFLTNFESVVSTADLLRLELELEFDVSAENNKEDVPQ